jgi:hypothetical protein
MSSKTIFTACAVMILALPANAETLSKRALLHRCYQQLTQTTLKPGDPLLAKVDAGQDPIDVCINDVLKSAYFSDDTTGNFVVAQEKIALGKLVTSTFQLLHSSWFGFRDIPAGAISGGINNNMMAVIEPNAGALYYTMTLLDQNRPANYFMNTSEYLRSLRDQGVAASSFYLATTPTNYYTAMTNFNGLNLVHQTGTPYGIRVLPDSERSTSTLNFTINSITTTTQDNYPRGRAYPAGTIKVFENFGGGILGLDSYMARTVDEAVSVQSDGVIELPRKWSQNIYKDLMCLDLPVIRPSDAQQFVDTTSDAPFRHQEACVACHASIDRMAGLIKSFALAERRTQLIWTTWVDKTHWGKGEAGDYSWSSNKRPTFTSLGYVLNSYIKEDHVGTLYYRGYDGRLVNEKVDSPTALGAKMSQQIEPYLCAATRYYRFFTGIDVNFTDPGASPLPLRPDDAVHYNYILNMTKDLVNADQSGQFHPKNMSALIEAILRSPQYKLSNFGAKP